MTGVLSQDPGSAVPWPTAMMRTPVQAIVSVPRREPGHAGGREALGLEGVRPRRQGRPEARRRILRLTAPSGAIRSLRAQAPGTGKARSTGAGTGAAG